MHGSINPCKEDLVIAADGGLEHLIKLGIVPDVIVGDFDSVDEGVLERQGVSEKDITRAKNCGKTEVYCEAADKSIEIFAFPIMKDETDMYLAYDIGVSRGYTDFELYGGVGGREDHTFANYCLLLKAKKQKNHLTLIGNGSKTFVIENEKVEIVGREGATVSVFSFGGESRGVSVLGLKYEARDVNIEPSCAIGVSNSFLKSARGEISVKDGALLVTVFD